MPSRLSIVLATCSAVWFAVSVGCAVHYLDMHQEAIDGHIKDFPPFGPNPTPAQLHEWDRRNDSRGGWMMLSAAAAFSVGLVSAGWAGVSRLRRRRDRLRPGFQVIFK